MTNTEFKEFKQAIISKEYLTKQEFTNVKNVGKQISETDLMQQYTTHGIQTVEFSRLSSSDISVWESYHWPFINITYLLWLWAPDCL